MINTKKINYIIYSDKYKKHILYTSFFNQKLNIINILNKNTFLTEICFFYNPNYNKKNEIVSKKNVVSEHWYWPLKNPYMKFFYNYSINNNGIEISGTQGQSIFSSAKGKVVYIGDIFKSYGKLIIIKHDNNYLSIYGFNKKVFVKLNDQVYANQKISTMGYSNNNLAKLYFDIRFQGTPINLLTLFPNIKLKKH
ncbi:peptidoglycan DD-metalloendopeptidase family protein [Buchnera aphidicola (Aphis fabae)]|uniref:Peptidoglycan DD-metalloendopeptidase family protein n=1 Tax=Buchnera aphidicola (Aphis fabae) TaxID=571430 RepID=A0A5J6ZE71_9GAMM|nr:peptidoglycan DD-metalloendopeptidase family protein [Buchnera aphidicola]QFQ32581.1 peptidoglycan DD-metalloendopeptidase family protein [Buchnera aphidicola (Aphis fabae)]